MARRFFNLMLVIQLANQGGDCVPSHIITGAMDIVDETTHEQVYSSEDDMDAHGFDREHHEDLDEVPQPGTADRQAMSKKNMQDTAQAILDEEQDEHLLEEEMIQAEEDQMHQEDDDFDHEDDYVFVPGSDRGFQMGVNQMGSIGGGSVMQAMMQNMVQQMDAMNSQILVEDDLDDEEPVGIIDTPMGRLVIQTIPFGDEDDDEHYEDEEAGGIPPEIIEMIRVTEAMHANAMAGSPFGGPPRQLQIQEDKGDNEDDGKPRFEESFDDIMARMNKIGEEIGEKHTQNKVTKLHEIKTSRSMQVLAAVGMLLFVFLISFLLSCFKSKNKLDAVGAESEMSAYKNSMKRVGKAD